jgi:hypothetical protein
MHAYLLVSPILLSNIDVLHGQAVIDSLDHGLLFLQLLHLKTLPTSSSLPLQSIELFLNELGILYPQFTLNNLKISDWVNVTLNVDDFGIIEASNDLEDCIYGTDVGQESIAETSTS